MAMFNSKLLVYQMVNGKSWNYTLWLFNIAMEAMTHLFIDYVPIKSDYFPWLC
jgi:hypothetical protein